MRSRLAVTLAVLAIVGCGKKGPPLEPIVRVPATVGDLRARRVGDDVFVTFSLPVLNVDGSTPVDIGRIEVYGYTGVAAPALARFTDTATLVGSVQGDAGARLTLHERLTPLAPSVSDARVRGASAPPPAAPVGRGTPAPTPAPRETGATPSRYYLAVPFSARGRAGPPSQIVEVPLVVAPDAPRGVGVDYTPEAVRLVWDRLVVPPPAPAPEVVSPGQAPPGPAVVEPPPGSIRYNVYRVLTEIEPATAAPTLAAPVAPTPLNPAPIAEVTFTDPIAIDGRRRCYSIGAVRGDPPRTVESRPSAQACVTPVDTFPPAPPSGLSAIAVVGGVDLIWEANLEADLVGYVVLRGGAGDDTLTPVTGDTLTETRFTDRDVQPGVRYVYAITAVDGRQPRPNVSGESARVEVTAR